MKKESLMTINIDLLSELCAVPGAPGYESRIRNFILKQIQGLVDALEVDTLGNIIAIKKGKENKRVAVTAHIDEIGFIVTHIEENGFLRFHTLGGFDPKTLTAQRVIIHGKEDILGVMGCKPIHVMTAEERNHPPKLADYFIDTGLDTANLKELVQVGDVITRERSLVSMGKCINAKSLDNRISVYILIEVLHALKNKELPYDFYAVFCVQEEVGLRGAFTAASRFLPDFAINLDVTVASDVPNVPIHEHVTTLGKGTAIKVMDTSAICDYRMVQYLKGLANAKEVKHQIEVLTGGGTDTASMQRAGAGGSIAGALSIPTRYLHQVIEMCHQDDVVSTYELLLHALENMDTFDWHHK